ncbi:MAG: hypothetical protein FJ296_05750 [Planctomycetes bacterium]|nr:hypothetical protein [Planctomycetota bacterium]
MSDSPAMAAGVLFLVHLAGAAPPLLARWSHRGLHFFVSVAAGVFLGVIFLHLLPELAARSTGDAAGDGHAHGPLLPWIAALAGLVALFFVERIVLARAEGAADPHTLVWTSSYVGLAAHSFATGLGFAPVANDAALLWTFVAGMAVHKAGESFTLATVMRLAGLPLRRAALLLLLYSASTPAGLLLGASLPLGPDSLLAPVLTGLACGTFLYVAVGDLLPEVFHGEGGRALGVLGLLLGIGAAAVGVVAMR